MLLPLEKDFQPNKYLGLSVEKPEIPDFVRVIANNNDLNVKSPVHISVVVTKNAVTLWKALAKSQNLEKSMQAAKDLFESFLFEYELSNEYFLHERTYSRKDLDENGYDASIPVHTRRSIVLKVIIPDFPRFYTALNEMFEIKCSLPVPHITLYTWSDYEPFKTRGIGINSKEEFKRFTKEVILPR